MKKLFILTLTTLFAAGTMLAQSPKTFAKLGSAKTAIPSVVTHSGKDLSTVKPVEHKLERDEKKLELKQELLNRPVSPVRPAQKASSAVKPRAVDAANPTIDELVGDYILKYTNALKGNDKSGAKISFSKKSDTEITVSGLPHKDYTIDGTYDAESGTLTFTPQNLELYQADTYLQFASWTTSPAAANPDAFSATWNGDAFVFDASTFIGVGANGAGWFWLGYEMTWQKPLEGDYSVAISMKQSCTSDNVIPFGVQIGTSAASAKYMLIQGQYSGSTANFEYVASLKSTITSGNNYYFDLSNDTPGIYSLFVVSVDADGKFVEGAVKWFFVQDYSRNGWISKGYARYSDDIIYGLYSGLNTYAGSQWGVEVQESSATPGTYRLVNLYGENSIFADEEDIHAGHDHFVNIDAADPTKVVIEDSPLGIQWNAEDGDWIVTTQQYGKLTDNTITFPTKGLFFTMASSWESRRGWSGNTNGKFKIELPGQLSISVTDAEGQPLEDALVTIDGKDVATTDENGQASITINGAGAEEFNVTITKEGYIAYETTVDFKKDGTATIKSTLEEVTAVVSEDGYDASLSGLYKVTLDRAFNAGWNTVCLPFAVLPESICEGAIAQSFSGCDANGLNFTKVDIMEANTPYLLYCPTATESGKEFHAVTLSAEAPKSITQGDFTFTGTYDAVTDMENKYGVATIGGEDKITKGAAGSTLKGTRAYFTTSLADVQSVKLNFSDGETTGIVTADTAISETFDAYTLSGVQVLRNARTLKGLQKGIYIVNGKKQVIE
ncbi:MAG: PEGA domain-containing protein [Paraprevotella sp.]|nr:PEGA domain-containing protein [Paraprevotella sp.]